MMACGARLSEYLYEVHDHTFYSHKPIANSQFPLRALCVLRGLVPSWITFLTQSNDGYGLMALCIGILTTSCSIPSP